MSPSVSSSLTQLERGHGVTQPLTPTVFTLALQPAIRQQLDARVWETRRRGGAGGIGVGGQHVTGQRSLKPPRSLAAVSQDGFLLVTFCICNNKPKKKREKINKKKKKKATAFGKIMSA